MLLERSWWAGFNGIYLVRFGFRMWEILIFKWFLPLKIQINSQKNQVLEGKISWGCCNTWANGTGHTSTMLNLTLRDAGNSWWWDTNVLKMGFGLVSLPITLTLVGSLRFSFQQFFATWQFKRSPVLLIQRILLKKISQRHFKDWLGIAIFRQQVTDSRLQKYGRILMFSQFLLWPVAKFG
jgi:hypothetical protein